MTDVTDVDRKAAADFFPEGLWKQEARDDVADALARHRQASIAPYVEALREARTELQHFCYSLRAGLYPSEFDNTRKAIAQIDALLPDTKGDPT